MTYGQWLRERRLAAGLTVEQLEERLGVSQGTVARYEQQRRSPRPDKRFIIGRVLAELGTPTPTMQRYLSLITDAVAWFEHPAMRYIQVPSGLRQVLASMHHELYGLPYAPTRLPPTPPGDVLLTVLAERGHSQASVARHLGVSSEYIHKVAHGRQRMTPWVALQLAAVLGGEPAAEFWCNLQRDVDLQYFRQAMDTQLREIAPL